MRLSSSSENRGWAATSRAIVTGCVTRRTGVGTAGPAPSVADGGATAAAVAGTGGAAVGGGAGTGGAGTGTVDGAGAGDDADTGTGDGAGDGAGAGMAGAGLTTVREARVRGGGQGPTALSGAMVLNLGLAVVRCPGSGTSERRYMRAPSASVKRSTTRQGTEAEACDTWSPTL